MFVFDAGDLSGKGRAVSESALPQYRRKGELQHEAFALVGIDGMVPGDGDFTLGIDWLTATSTKYDSPMLAANLVCNGGAPFPASRVVERGGVKLGVVGIVGRNLKVPDGCEITDPVAAMKQALGDLDDSDVTVALTHQTVAKDEELTEQVPEIDLVFTGSSGAIYETPRGLKNEALAFSAGNRGKKVGVAEFTLVPGASGFYDESAITTFAEKVDRTKKRLKMARTQVKKAEGERDVARAERRVANLEEQLVGLEAELKAASEVEQGPHHGVKNSIEALTRNIADHPGTLALVDKTKADIASGELAGQAARPARYEGPYIGSAACLGCHVEQAEQWRSTRHAKAWQTLVDDKRHLDRECFKCHSTGAHDKEGPTDPTNLGALKNVGCESCHGAGKAHVASPEDVDMIKSPDVVACKVCHSGERDGGRFDEATYRPRISH